MFVLPLASIPLGYVRGLIATLACGVALTAGPSCFAQEFEAGYEFDSTDAVAPAVVDVDRVYWLCDELMESGALDLEMSVVCTNVTESIKNDRFDGDFEAYAAWWREQKLAHAEELQTP